MIVNRLGLWAIAAIAGAAALPARASCDDLAWQWVVDSCRRLADTYQNGSYELLVSGYSYHVPATWTPERRAELNANAWGGGLGKTTEDGEGNNHTVYFLGFEDSHKHLQAQVGYAYTKFWGSRDGLQPGLGWTAAIVQRPDIFGGVPFPVVLPLFELRYGKAILTSTYIPTLNGGVNHGSTLYVFGRISLE